MCADGLPGKAFGSPFTECCVMVVLLELVRDMARDVYCSEHARRVRLGVLCNDQKPIQ